MGKWDWPRERGRVLKSDLVDINLIESSFNVLHNVMGTQVWLQLNVEYLVPEGNSGRLEADLYSNGTPKDIHFARSHISSIAHAASGLVMQLGSKGSSYKVHQQWREIPCHISDWPMTSDEQPLNPKIEAESMDRKNCPSPRTKKFKSTRLLINKDQGKATV